MGFAGKPSPACQPCRTTRRKCDLKKPTCSACMRKSVLCYGYRGSGPLIIRDETYRVSERARRDYRRLAAKNKEIKWTARPHVRGTAALPPKVPLPLEATAIGYFFSIFSRSGTFAYLPEYATSIAKDERVIQALCASALGSMALQYRNDDLSLSARRYYTTSLTCVNRDLADPSSSMLDSTLLRVLMLSAFEALDLHKDGDPGNWAAHIAGSCRLLVMRGKAQLQTQFGRELFHHASLNILVHSVLLGVAVPLDLTHLVEHATSCPGDMDLAGTYILSLLWRMALLAPGVQSMTLPEVLEKVLPLDSKANDFLDELHELAPFEAVRVADSDNNYGWSQNLCTYRGYMHCYNDQQTARLYNTARLIHLTLKEWMFTAATRPCGVDNDRQDWIGDKDSISGKILADSAKLVEDVLSSVPYSLDTLESRNSTEARYLIWPLARIASFNCCPTAAKRYISNRLLEIAEKFSLRRAQEAATILGHGGQAEGW